MYRCLLTVLALVSEANAAQLYGHLRPQLVGTHGLGSNVVLGGGNFVHDFKLPGDLVFQTSGGHGVSQGAGGSPAQRLDLQVFQEQGSPQRLDLQVFQEQGSPQPSGGSPDQGLGLQVLQGLVRPGVNPIRVSTQGPLTTSQEPIVGSPEGPTQTFPSREVHIPRLPYTISRVTTQVISTVTLTVAVTSDFITPIHATRTTTLVQLLPSREYKASKPDTRTIVVNRSLTRVDTTTLTSTEPRDFTVLAETPVLSTVTNTRTFLYSITHILTTHVTKRDHTYVTVTLQLPPTETVTSTSVLVTTLYTTIVYPTVRNQH
ncbi:uncharacterized protein LOC143035507 [Oratosquilla oratoria]|uniref:uncharacterized protein LOC143035507 n=1 Tax=Oratosquilla oratoria TaxID=337810 RepID=UPI003F75DB09